MNMTGQHIFTRKWVFYLMTFVFFWLVIGDLIALHQKAIYGFDPYGKEFPFAKTKQSTVKIKMDKGSKFDKSKDLHHLDALINKAFRMSERRFKCTVPFVNTFTVFLSQSAHPLLALRAPPKL